MIWVHGHCDIVGNEWADSAAGRACSLIQEGVVCLRSSVRSVMKGVLRKNTWVHARSKVVYESGINVKCECVEA